MDFDFSQEQRLLADSARDLLKRECPTKKVRELMETPAAIDATLWSAIADQGWTGMILPEEVGGLGLEFVDQCVVMEEMGRANLPGPFFSNLWGSALLLESEGKERSRVLLEGIASGEKKVTVAWLDGSSSWSSSAIGCSIPGSGSISLTGTKRFVTDAAAVDVILVVVRQGDGFAVVPVAAGTRGMRIEPTSSMDQTRPLFDVVLEGVAIDRSEVLEVPKAETLERANDFAAVALCAELVGLMQNLMEMTLDYTQSRQQFDRPIGIFQAIQHQCADMLLYTESARSATYHAAWALDAGIPGAARAAAVAKAYCSEGARRVANHACQCHGGIGFTWEHDLHLYYKRAKLSEVLLGDPSFHRERVAQMVLDRELVGEL
jgi:alkylation response protein AidB-like acyl-CoA dehydrogenase